MLLQATRAPEDEQAPARPVRRHAAAAPADASAKAAHGFVHAQLPPEVLLIVDDDEFMLDMLPYRLRRLLPADATTLLTARTYDEAAQLIRENSERRLVVLSDFDLREEHNGLDVLAEAAAVSPASTRILYSGHARHEIGDIPEGSAHAFIEKPFRLDDLVGPLLSAIHGEWSPP